MHGEKSGHLFRCAEGKVEDLGIPSRCFLDAEGPRAVDAEIAKSSPGLYAALERKGDSIFVSHPAAPGRPFAVSRAWKAHADGVGGFLLQGSDPGILRLCPEGLVHPEPSRFPFGSSELDCFPLAEGRWAFLDSRKVFVSPKDFAGTLLPNPVREARAAEFDGLLEQLLVEMDKERGARDIGRDTKLAGELTAASRGLGEAPRGRLDRLFALLDRDRHPDDRALALRISEGLRLRLPPKTVQGIEREFMDVDAAGNDRTLWRIELAGVLLRHGSSIARKWLGDLLVREPDLELVQKHWEILKEDAVPLLRGKFPRFSARDSERPLRILVTGQEIHIAPDGTALTIRRGTRFPSSKEHTTIEANRFAVGFGDPLGRSGLYAECALGFAKVLAGCDGKTSVKELEFRCMDNTIQREEMVFSLVLLKALHLMEWGDGEQSSPVPSDLETLAPWKLRPEDPMGVTRIFRILRLE
jgi:hypothetical protein